MSTYQAEQLTTSGRVPNDKVIVFPYQVDSQFFARHAPRSGALKPYVVAAGLETRDYGTLFDAVRELDVEVRIAAASIWALRSSSWKTLEVPPNVTLASYGYSELRELYAGAALAVVPLHENPYQHGITAIQEAMAMGLPVIVTRTQGQSDVVVDRRRYLRGCPGRSTFGTFGGRVTRSRRELESASGMYVGVGDSDSLRKCIQYLLEHPDLSHQLGAQAAFVAREVLSLNRFVERATRLVDAAWNNQPIRNDLVWYTLSN